METKAKCILVMVAMCILVTPAFSQGGERDGRNGNPGSNMGPEQDNAMMSGGNGAPFGQGSGMMQDQAPDAPRFKGCNTLPQNMVARGPIKPPSDKPEGPENKLDPKDAPHDEPAPWSYNQPGDGPHDGPSFGFAGDDDHVPPRSIMGPDHPQVPPKKSIMEEKHHRAHKGPLKPLNPEDLPELPPMKSMMDHP